MHQEQVGFREAVLYWLKLGFISFGGPAGQIAETTPGPLIMVTSSLLIWPHMPTRRD